MQALTQHYVNGAWQTNHGHKGHVLINPATERSWGELTYCDLHDVEAAVSAAQAGLAAWSRSSLDERRQVLQQLLTELRARSDAFVDALAQEIGCPVTVGRLLQVTMPQGNLERIIEGIDHIPWEERIYHSKVVQQPVGVVAGLTPWNAPLHQIVAKVAGVIAAGASIVLKPSELTPRTALLFTEALHACDLPPGVFNLVWGGADIGQQLVVHADIHMISFTGSDHVGRQVMTAAAPTLKRLALELGGKSAAILLDDADLAQALPAVLRQTMANSGQTCVCQSRLIVPRARLAEVEQRLAELAATIVVGDPNNADTQMGPVATLAQRERVLAGIERARQDGARILFGGQRPGHLSRGYYVMPTVVSQVRPDSTLAQREVFGPVLAVLTHQGDDDAITLANGTPYGLSGAVWSADNERAERVARQLRTGQVVVNGAPPNMAVPFGGFGHSGFGRENGRFSIQAFLEPQAIQLPPQ